MVDVDPITHWSCSGISNSQEAEIPGAGFRSFPLYLLHLRTSISCFRSHALFVLPSSSGPIHSVVDRSSVPLASLPSFSALVMASPSKAAVVGSSSSTERPEAAPAGFQKLSASFCAAQYAASLKCLDDANYDKSKCQEHFDAYKECKKRERELRLEANRKSKRFF